MASSSSPACETLKICSHSSETIMQKEEILEKDWLQLGFGSNGINKCKKNHQAACGDYNGQNLGLEVDERGLKLGLGIGLDLINGDHICGVEIVEAPSYSSSKAYNGYNSGLEVSEKEVELGLETILGLIDGDYNQGVELTETPPHRNEKELELKDGDHTYGIEIMEAPPQSSRNLYYDDHNSKGGGVGEGIHSHAAVQENEENGERGAATRVVPQPSSRAGLWFALISSTNGKGESLPQIPQRYIRVKDENMTILMVKRYLVTKLGLSNDAEVEIRCMGHNISQLQTLKQVRDTVWLPELFVNSSSISNNIVNYVMPLHYTTL